jgi:hypothetical protein
MLEYKIRFASYLKLLSSKTREGKREVFEYGMEARSRKLAARWMLTMKTKAYSI